MRMIESASSLCRELEDMRVGIFWKRFAIVIKPLYNAIETDDKAMMNDENFPFWMHAKIVLL